MPPVPTEAQQKVLDLDPKVALIAFDVGGGKTLLTLWLSEGSVLVVSPKTNKVDGNFARDAKLIGMDSPDHISKEEFGRDWQILPRYDTLIFDEGEFILGVSPTTHKVKGVDVITTSQIHDATISYIEKNNPNRIYIATATPVEKPMQAWAAARILGKLKKSIPDSFKKFREDFYIPIKKGYSELWLERKGAKYEEKLQKFVKSLGFFAEMDKTPPIVKDIYVPISNEQEMFIKDTFNIYPPPKKKERGTIDPVAAVRNSRLYGVECGVYNGIEFDDIAHTAKKMPNRIPNNICDSILPYVLKHKNPIIFCLFTEQILYTAEYFRKHTSKKIYIIYGKVKEEERSEALRAIGEDDNCILICQSSIGRGWQTLISDAMFVLSVNKWRDYHQMKGRNQRYVNRYDQKYIYRIFIGDTSQAAWKRIDNKQDFNIKIYEP